MMKIKDTGIKAPLIAKTKKLRDATGAATKVAAAASSGLQNDLMPDVKIVMREISSLIPAKVRTRKTEPQHLESLIRAIAQFKFVGAILIKGNTIVDGIVRVEALQALQEPKVPCIDVGHLSDEQTRLLSISFNRISETGSWDLNALRLETLELDALGFDLSLTGFTLPEIDIIQINPSPEEAAAVLDAVPEISTAVVSVLGDCWSMGEHRLICGDATKAQTYQTLLGDEVVAGVFTDPPYGCAIVGNVSGLGKVKHAEFVQGSKGTTEAELQTLFHAFLTQCRIRCIAGAVIYAFIDWRQYARLEGAARSAGLTAINTAVWDKGSGSMGALLRSAYELVGVFCNGAVPATNNVQLGKHGRDRSNIWRYAGANKPGSSAAAMLSEHPTPKPVQLVSDALLDTTKKGDIVLDPFLGSGTTIVACMEVQRVGRGIELDPKYVDVALRRWMTLADEQAVLIATGETFTQVAERRAAEVAATNSANK